MLFGFLIFILYPVTSLCQFNMTEYRRMPPLYNLEDYDECLDTTETSSYCLLITEIIPNDTSALWNQIANFSAVTKRHYRHDLLHFGMCLNPCRQLVESLNGTLDDELATGIIKNEIVIEYFTDVLSRETEHRLLYDKLLNICVNYKFQKQYHLQLRSFIEYCVSNRDKPYTGFWEILLYTLVGTILFLVVVSSNYDRQLRSKSSSDDFYRRKLPTQQDNLLTAFSIKRNYFRYVTLSRNETEREMQFFGCYRFVAVIMVIIAHVALLLKSLPTRNPEFVEARFHSFGSNILINGTVIIQVFLVMSSFFLYIGFKKMSSSDQMSISTWGKLVLYRYVRLAPSLAFTILLNVTILPRLGDGPFWEHVVSGEYELCRKTWWKNLLFINNFTMQKSCLHQTWYIATDFQLYILMCIVLIFIERYPKSRNYVLGAGVAISFLSPGVVTYLFKLNGTHREAPGSYRFLFWTDGETLFKGNTPFYTNFGGFVFGTITAIIYLKLKSNDITLKDQKSKLNRLFFLALPLPFLLLLTGEIFFRYDFPRPSIWVALYACLFRNLWAIGCCAILLLMCFKIGNILYKFSSLDVFSRLGKLGYQVFLVHSIVIRVLAGGFRQSEHGSNSVLLMHIVTCTVICFILAFFLYVCLELPLTNITHTILRSAADDKVKPNFLSSIQTSLENKKENETVVTTNTLDVA